MTEKNSKKTLLIGLIAILAVIVGIIAVRQSDPEPLQNNTLQVGETMPLEIEDGTYIFDNQTSSITWEGNKLTGSHTGEVDLENGRVEITSGEIVSGEFSIDLASLVTLDGGEGNTDLDTHLKSADFFDIENHPNATFVISNVESAGGNDYEVTGNLTVRGVTNEVSFPAIITTLGNQMMVKGTIEVERAPFEIGTDKKLADIALTDTFIVNVNLVTGTDNNDVSATE